MAKTILLLVVTGGRGLRAGALFGSLFFCVAVFFVALFLFYSILDWQNVHALRFLGLLALHTLFLAALYFLVSARYKSGMARAHLVLLGFLFAFGLVAIWKNIVVLVILVFVCAVAALPVTLGDVLARRIHPRRRIPLGLLFASLFLFYFATVVNYSYLHSFFGQFDFVDGPCAVRYTLLPNKDYEVNSMRYRGPLMSQPDPGSPRILFLGDSSTYGLFLPYAKSYPALVQEYLRTHGYDRASTLNAAVPAHNLLDVTERFREFRSWNPDFVFVMEGMHVNEIDAERTRDPTPVPRAIERHLRGIRTMYLFLFGRGSRPVPDAGARDACVQKWAAALQGLVQDIGKGGAKVVLLQYPSPAISEDIRGIVRRVAAVNHVPLIDLFSGFSGKEREWLMIDQIHPNARGHAEIAARIGAFLSRELERGWIASHAPYSESGVRFHGVPPRQARARKNEIGGP